MIMTIDRLAHTYGERVLFKDISFSIEMGDKIGIIGVNGCGKSTLLRDVAKGEAGEGGSITVASGTVIEYLPQNPEIVSGATVLEQVFCGESQLMQVLRNYETAQRAAENNYQDERLQSVLLEAQQEMDAVYGWQL